MGGKNKPNRTKNNARPSSSARSAELLQNQTGTFFGFGTVKDGAVSILPNYGEIEENIYDADFQLVLKKMSKKDATTKCKALYTFSDLCTKAETENVKAILPSWVRLYSQLCCDNDHRVREATQRTHKVVISKVKKYMAPYLKEIIGAWFTAQYDTYAPAASAAVSAFEESFSPPKIAEVIAFCQEEILNYFYTNLIVLTPQTSGNSKTLSAEELENRYLRFVSSSLQGYAYYLQKIPKKSLEAGEETHNKILNSPKFWKLAQHKHPNIRYGFFKSVVALSEFAVDLIKTKATQLASVIFNHLSEEDSLVLPVIWEAVLISAISVPECWNFTETEKKLMPKLFQLLRCGGNGHAMNIFPKLLPLLSKFPLHNMDNISEFYTNMFKSMRTGLLDATVNRSQSESRVVASTFIECLQYIIMRHREDDKLVSELIKNELIVSITSNVKQTYLVTQPLLCQVAYMLRSWHRNSPSYESITNYFWDELQQSLEELLKSSICQEDIEKTLKSVVEMLTIMHNPNKFSSKSNKDRVRFHTESEEAPITTKECKEVEEPKFDKALETFTKVLVQNYMDLFMKDGNSLYIKTLLNLSNVFDTRTIFPNVDDLLKTLSKVLSDVPQDVSIEFGFKILTLVEDGNHCDIINMLANLNNVDYFMISRFLLKSLITPVREWIKSDYYSMKYMELLNNVLTQDEENIDAAEVLCGFLTPEFLLNPKICADIVSKISESVVLQKGSNIIDIYINGFGQELCSCPQYNDLIVNLFIVSYQDDSKEKKYIRFLKTLLLKFKYYRMNESLTLLKTISKNIIFSNGNAEDKATILTSIVEVLYDINITEVCEFEEIEQFMTLLKIFIQPPTNLLQCSILFTKFAYKCHEINGDCLLPNFDSTNTIDEYRGIDPHIRCFKEIYENTYENVEINESLVFEYLQWLEMSTILIAQVLSAYPVSYRVFSMKKPGKYIVAGNEDKTVEDNLCEDEIPIYLSKDEWTGIKIEAGVESAFEDEYLDDNMLLPIANDILYVIEGAAAINTLQNYYPEIEQYSIIPKKSGEIFKLVQTMLSKGTPIEFEFLYNLCQVLVKNNKHWAGLLSSLQCLFYRQFNNSKWHNTNETITATISAILDSKSLEQDVESIAKLTTIVKHSAHCISLDHWQMISIQVDTFIKQIYSSSSKILTEDTLRSAAIVSSFFIVAQDTFLNCLTRSEDENISPESVRMWNEVVEKELWNQIFLVWRNVVTALHSKYDHKSLQLLSNSSIKNIKCYEAFIRRLCEAVLSGLHLRDNQMCQDDTLLAQQLFNLLLSPQTSLQITCFKVLLSFVPELVQADTVLFQTYVGNNEEKELFTVVRDCDWTLKLLEKALDTTQTVVDAMLIDLKIGHTCTVQPFTDAFTYSHAYLMMWCILMEMCGEAHVALRYQYAAWLKRHHFFPAILKSVFNLMPALVIHGESARDTASLFETYGELNLRAKLSSSWIEQRTCFVYRMCLQRLPAAVREWWSEQEHHMANLISRTTSLHISPILIASELKNVQNPDMAELENVKVVVSLPAREVTGIFSIDETPMQTIISLPNNYPLGMIKVDYISHTALPKAWRISMFLMHRNGSLRDALALWKSDLDKKFEGVEDCKICYSILLGPNFDIPKQACKTCHKKFHSACLLKWFNTSNKSTCPHCRNQY